MKEPDAGIRKSRRETWFARILHDCRAITPIIGESLDRKISGFEWIKLKLHLFACRACQNYLSNLRSMREIFELKRKSQKPARDARLRSETRERIKNALKDSMQI